MTRDPYVSIARPCDPSGLGRCAILGRPCAVIKLFDAPVRIDTESPRAYQQGYDDNANYRFNAVEVKGDQLRRESNAERSYGSRILNLDVQYGPHITGAVFQTLITIRLSKDHSSSSEKKSVYGIRPTTQNSDSYAEDQCPDLNQGKARRSPEQRP